MLTRSTKNILDHSITDRRSLRKPKCRALHSETQIAQSYRSGTIPTRNAWNMSMRRTARGQSTPPRDTPATAASIVRRCNGGSLVEMIHFTSNASNVRIFWRENWKFMYFSLKSAYLSLDSAAFQLRKLAWIGMPAVVGGLQRQLWRSRV